MVMESIASNQSNPLTMLAVAKYFSEKGNSDKALQIIEQILTLKSPSGELLKATDFEWILHQALLFESAPIATPVTEIPEFRGFELASNLPEPSHKAQTPLAPKDTTTDRIVEGVLSAVNRSATLLKLSKFLESSGHPNFATRFKDKQREAIIFQFRQNPTAANWQVAKQVRKGSCMR
jgi:hypothetical protein